MRTKRRAAAVVVCVALAGLTAKNVMYFSVEHGQRPRWREAVEFVQARQGLARLVATSPPPS